MSTDTAGLTQADRAELHGTLQRLREENEDDLRRARETLAELGVNGMLVDPSMREVGTNAEYLLEDASSIIEMIDAALVRMQDGTYGVCTSCGQPIPIGRLRVRPYQPTCVRCSS
jgi:RNA polymerase-binding transcription factor DksA